MKKILHQKRMEIMVTISELKDLIISENFDETIVVQLRAKEEQLNFINQLIDICETRNRY